MDLFTSISITIHRLTEEFGFFLFGGRDKGINEGICEQNISDPEAHVRISFLLPQLFNILDAAGFEIVDMRAAAVRNRHRLLAPVAWGIKLAQHLLSKRRDRE